MSMLKLSDVLANLRDEIVTAQQAGEGKDLRFLIDDIEVELQLAVTDEGSGKAGFKVWTLGAELGAKTVDATTQKLRLKLKLVDKHGNAVVPIARTGRRR
jgi:hypothetical protein